MNDKEKITSNEEDIIYIQRVLQGDKNEFEYIINKYQKVIYSLTAMYIQNREECREIVQEIFFKLFLKLSQFNISQHFFTWMYTLSLNYLRNYKRKKRIITAPPNQDEQLSGHGNPIEYSLYKKPLTPEEIYIKKEDQKTLHRIINGLNPKYKDPIILYYFQELSYEEISDILQLSLNSVRTRLSRAKDKMLKKANKLKLF